MIALFAFLPGLSPKTRMYRSTNSQDRCTLVPRLFTLVTHVLQLLFKLGSSFQQQWLLFYFRLLLRFCIFSIILSFGIFHFWSFFLSYFPAYHFANVEFQLLIYPSRVSSSDASDIILNASIVLVFHKQGFGKSIDAETALRRCSRAAF